jgi:hypothetical protein
MSNTYYWEIANLEVKPSANGLQNIVKKIHWVYVVRNENGAAEHTFGVVDVPDPNPESFIQYEQISEEMVISWLKTQLDEESLKPIVDEKLYKSLNPELVYKNKPWQPAPKFMPPTESPEEKNLEVQIADLKGEAKNFLEQISVLKERYEAVVAELESLSN